MGTQYGTTIFDLQCPKMPHSCENIPNFSYPFEWSPVNVTLRKLSDLAWLSAPITFVGDSFSKLLHDALRCYLETLQHVRIVALPTATGDCQKNMKLYNESLKSCKERHSIRSYQVQKLRTNESFDISFIWAPFLCASDIVDVGKPGTKDYFRNLTLDTSVFLGSEEARTLMRAKAALNGSAVLFADKHWSEKVYSMWNGTHWTRANTMPEHMMRLRQASLQTAQQWLSAHAINTVLVDKKAKQPEFYKSVSILPLGSTDLLSPPKGLASYEVSSHWCIEVVPWHLVRIILDLMF
jgi:hypothetical protein